MAYMHKLFKKVLQRSIVAILTFNLLLTSQILLHPPVAQAAAYDITPYSIPSAENDSSYIASSADGDVWFVERANQNLARIDATTGAITEFSVPGIGADCGGITSGPDGNLWYIKGSTNKIGRWDLSTNTETTFDLPASSCYSGIITGPDNNLWFTREDGKVGKMTTGGAVTLYDTPNGGVGMQLAIGADNNIWFANPTDDSLVKVQTNGTITSIPLPNNASQAYGIAKDNNGNLWVSALGSDSILKYNINANQFTTYSTPANSYPCLLSLGGDGNIWFGSASGQGFGRVTSDGTTTMFSLPDNVSASIFNLAMGSYGNIWGLSSPHSDPGMVYKVELPNSQLQVRGNSNDCSQLQLISGSDTTGISEFQQLSAADVPTDGTHEYPVGLADFRINVPAGSTQRVNLIFQNCSSLDQVIARKYSSRTNTFTTIRNAQISQTVFNNQPATLLSYDITDGGPLDDDATANGIIVDPVGLATGVDTDGGGATTSTEATDSLANTGQATKTPLSITVSLLTVGVAALVIGWRTKPSES